MTYTYDYASNRTSRDNLLATGTNNVWDQDYTYDGLHRLKETDQGTASDTTHLITTKKFEQNQTLDQLGNWSNLTETDGTTTTLNQNRTHNVANELTAIDSWQNPTFDNAGNMTTIPAPKYPTAGYDAKYDAWNRLVELKYSGNLVQTNQYDGLNRRIIRLDHLWGGDVKVHFYYNEQWQVLEERKEVSGTIDPDPLAQYVYHPHYIDAVAIRYYDKLTAGTFVAKHFYLHDANYNVTAILASNGAVIERYHYSPYGEVTYLNADFSKKTTQSSAIGNELLFTGRRLDPETGLQLNRNRFYHAGLGRWVSVDPILYDGGGYNLFEYAGGMPTGHVDPLGLIPGWKEFGCSSLAEYIKKLIEMIKKRLEDLKEDKHHLYGDCDSIPRSQGGAGTWDGHVEAYENLQKHVLKVLEFFDRIKCDPELINKKYSELVAIWPPPLAPKWYTDSHHFGDLNAQPCWACHPVDPGTPFPGVGPPFPPVALPVLPGFELPPLPEPAEGTEEAIVVGIGGIIIVIIIIVGLPVGI